MLSLGPKLTRFLFRIHRANKWWRRAENFAEIEHVAGNRFPFGSAKVRIRDEIHEPERPRLHGRLEVTPDSSHRISAAGNRSAAGSTCRLQDTACGGLIFRQLTPRIDTNPIKYAENLEQHHFVTTGEVSSYNGRGGIRTHGTLLTYTHFPGVRLKPLGHPSQCDIVSQLHQSKRARACSGPFLQRTGRDSNSRYPCRYAGFRDRCLQPLGHLSSQDISLENIGTRRSKQPALRG